MRLRKKPVHAKVKDWKKYLEVAINKDRYDEAKFVTALILNKKDDEEVKTPPNYKVQVKSDIVFDETEESKSKIKVEKTFKIIKTNKGRY